MYHEPFLLDFKKLVTYCLRRKIIYVSNQYEVYLLGVIIATATGIYERSTIWWLSTLISWFNGLIMNCQSISIIFRWTAWLVCVFCALLRRTQSWQMGFVVVTSSTCGDAFQVNLDEWQTRVQLRVIPESLKVFIAYISDFK